MIFEDHEGTLWVSPQKDIYAIMTVAATNWNYTL